MKRHMSKERERERAGDAKMFARWKRWHREQREEVLAGPHGPVLAELYRMIKNLQLIQPLQLIGFVRSINWAVIDSDTKLTTLHELNAAITRFREKRGFEPIDDSVSDEPPFRTLKAILFPRKGARRGAARHE
jgi:hypothetical protein